MPKFDLIGVGSPIMDLLARVPDDFLHRHVAGEKGGMVLVDHDEIGNQWVQHGGEAPAIRGQVGGGAPGLAGVVVAVRRARVDARAAGDAEQGHEPDRQDDHDDERSHQAPPLRNPLKGHLWLLRNCTHLRVTFQAL